jgi:hypothetical protein
MKAKVTHLNSKLGYYSATTEQKKVVFALVRSSAIKLDDMLVGDIERCGMVRVFNETQNAYLDVEIKEVHDLGSPFHGHSGSR